MCGNEVEIMDHLFLTCSYSKQVWQMVLQKCGLIRQTRTGQKKYVGLFPK